MRINEIFYSLQGEGVFTGVPAVFVRFSGCNRACDFCDTDFHAFTEMTEEEIVAAISQYPAQHVVITGGEPARQVTESLVDKIKATGRYVQIETNGSLPVPDNIDWITCSPKEQPWRIQRVDELKIVFQDQDVEEIASHFDAKAYCLQPCSCLNTEDTILYILTPPRWRLSLQTHKLLEIQ